MLVKKKVQSYKNLKEVLAEFEKFQLEVRCLDSETVCIQKRAVTRLLPEIGVANLNSLKHLSPSKLQSCIVDYTKRKGAGAYKGARYALVSYFRFCELANLLEEPLQHWLPSAHRPKFAKVPFYLQEKHIQQIQDCLDLSLPNDIRDCAILTMLSTYGVRNIQIRNLKLSDIDWSNSRIYFAPVKRGKSLTLPLLVPVGNSLLRYLREVRPQCSSKEVFLTLKTNTPLKRSNSLSSMVISRIKKAGLQLPNGVPIGTHLFRHSFASRLLEKDVSFKYIADLLAHRNLNSTLIYTKVDLKTLKQVCLEWPEVN